MSQRGSKRAACPRVSIRTVESPTLYAMRATEGGHAITAGVARPTLGTRKGRQCRG